MQCRKIHVTDTGSNIVWFGSYGKDSANHALKDINYVKDEDAVISSLIPRLSIIKGELWYQSTYGIPLLEKVRSKDIFDSALLNMILIHPQVSGVKSFTSTVNNHQYNFDFIVNTIYNSDVSVSSSSINSQLYI